MLAIVYAIVAEKLAVDAVDVKVVGSTRRDLDGVGAVHVCLIKQGTGRVEIVQHRVANREGGGGELGLREVAEQREALFRGEIVQRAQNAVLQKRGAHAHEHGFEVRGAFAHVIKKCGIVGRRVKAEALFKHGVKVLVPDAAIFAVEADARIGEHRKRAANIGRNGIGKQREYRADIGK